MTEERPSAEGTQGRAVVYTEFGSPDVLHVDEITVPPASEGHLLVRVEAAGINPIDAKLRGGLRTSDPITTPRRVGRDGSGVVVALGEGVEGFRVGEPVSFIDTQGSYATTVRVAAAHAVPRPANVSAVAGAGIGIPCGTAYQALRSLAVGPGDTLLLHGGSGSVGQAAIQYAVLWGARVVATCSARRAERVAALGATPIAYGAGVVERAREAAPAGFTVALDAAGTDEALTASLDLVSDKTRIATIVRGADADSLGIRAFSGGSPHPLTDIENAWRAGALPVTMALLAAGAFSIEEGPEFSLDRAADAHRALEAGVDGKAVIVP